MLFAFKALSYVPAFFLAERVAEARVSRSLRWLHVAVQLERLYISVWLHTFICFDCEPRTVVRIRVRRCVIRVRINETVVRIRIVTTTTNDTAMETLYLFCSLTDCRLYFSLANLAALCRAVTGKSEQTPIQGLSL